MDSVFINKNAYILNGSCKRIKGNVISADSEMEEVGLKVDEETTIITKEPMLCRQIITRICLAAQKDAPIAESVMVCTNL